MLCFRYWTLSANVLGQCIFPHSSHSFFEMVPVKEHRPLSPVNQTEVTISFVIVKIVLKEHWSEFKVIMKINNFIHVPVWPLVFLNKYPFFIHPPLDAQKEIFFHDMMQFRFETCIFNSWFFFSGLTKCRFEVWKVLNDLILKTAKQTEHLYSLWCFRWSFQQWTNQTILRMARCLRPTMQRLCDCSD